MKRATALLFLAALVLAAGCSSSSKSASSSSSTAGSNTTATTTGGTADTSGSSTTTTGGSGFPGARGCSAPSSEAIGAVWGVTMTKKTNTADSGCLWETSSPSPNVQVSYPPLSEFSSVRVNFLHAGTVTDITIPGATTAFIKLILDVGGHTNRNAYVIYPNGVVQVAVNGSPTDVTDDKVLAVTKVIVGA